MSGLRALPGLTLVGLAILPFITDGFALQLVAKMLVMAIFAMSLDLLVGYAGLVSLGHAATFGIAGYALALSSPESGASSLWLSLPVALAVSALFAAATGALALRARGVYFIMVTLAFAQMAYFVFHDTDLGGGSDGLYIARRPEAAVASLQLVDFDRLAQFYWFALASFSVVYLLLRRVVNSPFGRALVGIRENESRMRALGYGTYAYLLAAYVIAGTVAGFAGYLSAAQFGFVNPELLSWHSSGGVLMMVILGGKGTLLGPAAGAFALILLQEWLNQEAIMGAAARHWQLGMGLVIIAVALYLPRGLAGIAAARGGGNG